MFAYLSEISFRLVNLGDILFCFGGDSKPAFSDMNLQSTLEGLDSGWNVQNFASVSSPYTFDFQKLIHDA